MDLDAPILIAPPLTTVETYLKGLLFEGNNFELIFVPLGYAMHMHDHANKLYSTHTHYMYNSAHLMLR